VDFDDAVTSAKAAWSNELGRIAVVDAGSAYASRDAEAYRTVLYSSMYRASKYPRDLAEVDFATGGLVHWSPYTGQVRSATSSLKTFMLSCAEFLLRNAG